VLRRKDAEELGPVVDFICTTTAPLSSCTNAMNKLPPSSRYVCRNCIQRLARQTSASLTRSQVRLQSTDASQDDAPNARLRIQKHWNGDARAKFRATSPTKSILHMSKTTNKLRLELTDEQKPTAAELERAANEEEQERLRAEESRPLTMRERRQQRRDGTDGRPVNTAQLRAIREKRRIKKQQLMEQAVEEGNEIASSQAQTQPHKPLIKKPKGLVIRKWAKNMPDHEDELVPSPPSAPLGRRPKPQTTLPSAPEAPTTTLSLNLNNLEGFNWYWESYPPTIAQKSTANHFFTTHGRNAKLLRSVAQFRLFPESDVPEVAFVGRSNVGKSSLLNAVVNADIKALLARTSSTPGFTKTMNLYGIGAGNGVTIKKQPSGREKIVGFSGLTIVDMPGYGEGSLAAWGAEIMKYITHRKNLRRVFLLIDAEHGIKDKDRSLLASLRIAGVSHQVIMSKLDKLYIPPAREIKRHDGKTLKRLAPKGSLSELRETMEELKDDIQPPVGGGALGEILGVSAETLVEGKRLGVDHVRFAVLKAVGLDGSFQRKNPINTLETVE
jgi:GTP-binding protein